MAFKQGTAQNSPTVHTWLSQSICVTAWREITDSLLEFDYVEEIRECQRVPECVWFDRTVEEYAKELENSLNAGELPLGSGPLVDAEVNTIRAWLRIKKVMEGAIG